MKRMKTAGTAVMILSLAVLCSCANEAPAASATPEAREEQPVVIDREAALAPEKKTETVTVRTDAAGNVEKITAEIELQPAGSGPVYDCSTLTGIRNREGDEECETDGESLYWQNLGSPITYEGTAVNALPVGVQVSCWLDGQWISPADLAGKSGSLRLRFDYSNYTGGTGFVPFLAVTLVLLDDDVFHDVEITNGRLITASGEQMAFGYALPGLQEAMALGRYELTQDLEIPEYVELTARVEDFELAFTSTVFSNGVFKDIADEDLRDFDDLSSDMKEMASGFSEVLDGIGTLQNGMNEYGSGLNRFIDGVNQLSGYSGSVSEMASTIQEQLPDLLETVSGITGGISQMNAMVQQLNVPAMEEGTAAALQQFEADSAELQEQLTALQETLAAMSTSLAEIEAYEEAVNTHAAVAAQLLTAADLSGISSALAGQKEAALAAAGARLDELGLDEETRAEVGAVVNDALAGLDVSGAADEAAAGINERLNQAAAELAAIPAAPAAVIPSVDTEAMAATMEDLLQQAEILQGGYENLGNLPAMTAQLKTSFSQLAGTADQVNQLVAAYKPQLEGLPGQLNSLAAALKTLGSASAPLKEGYSAISGGVEELRSGLQEFNDEAIAELARIGGSELGSLLSMVRSMRRNDRLYNNYTGLPEGTEGEVRFVFETAEIKP